MKDALKKLGAQLLSLLLSFKVVWTKRSSVWSGIASVLFVVVLVILSIACIAAVITFILALSVGISAVIVFVAWWLLVAAGFVTAEPTLIGCFALGAVLFVVRTAIGGRST